MKRFIAGLLIGASLMSGVAYASGGKFEVAFQAVQFYFDGVQKSPMGNQGVFIHQGTTYVPIRFISENLGKEVIWDGKNKAVLINEKLKEISYQDGTYRGAYVDSPMMQVGVEFKLESNIVTAFSFKHLEYKGKDYLKEEEDQTIIDLKAQYDELANYLIGKDIRGSLADLYKPGIIVTNTVDTFTGATLRGGKVISATRDALNRGVYKPSATENLNQPLLESYGDGTYRGTYIDGGYQQVGVEFKLESNIVTAFSFKHLEYKGKDYLKEKEDQTIIGLKAQYDELANYLIGKDIRGSLADLYKPGIIVTNTVDTFTGATLRGGKVISATRDALNRGLYKPEANGQSGLEIVKNYEDGIYRGAYVDGGYRQVGVEFKLENNIVTSFSLKHLEYKGINYINEKENQTIVGLREQYDQLANYLIGKDIQESLMNLYKPGEIVTNQVDTFTGATIRSGKIISATRDALNRGVYSYSK
ncbi:FMN-binding protein [Alkaliphilus serpentinus]|uniref:Copper amine oxidase N-terminal domain-containing protein n=1 Tax=Alkaliphilus serpentinus TaxID=1482731 RepID=A0A833HM90_9FIRM|nr:FMN-binding protein [Alkaliphilus serpentinus]KAB3527289.1 copper amine oxidase N-terminal domain-containing protein [Alkaliphilus serpentinus]